MEGGSSPAPSPDRMSSPERLFPKFMSFVSQNRHNANTVLEALKQEDKRKDEVIDALEAEAELLRHVVSSKEQAEMNSSVRDQQDAMRREKMNGLVQGLREDFQSMRTAASLSKQLI